MKICLYWYSATGNTMHLARAACDRWREMGHEPTAFDMLNRKKAEPPHPDQFDRVVFAFPVMVFRPPFTSIKFLEELPNSQKGVETHLLITSGGMGAKSDSWYANLLAQKGFMVAGAEEFTCTDSYIPFRKYFKFMEKKGLPNERTEKAAKAFADRVAAASKPPRQPWRGLGRSFFNSIGVGAPPNAGYTLLGPRRLEAEKCTGCTLCAKLCPTGAITMEGERPTVNEKACIGCVACFNNCPPGAWRLKKFGLEYHYRYEGEMVWKEL